jgi:hypothetical protein
MTFRRIGLATAMAAITVLPACSMWHSMTDRMTGRSGDTTSASRSGASGGAMGQAGTTGTTSGSGSAYGTSSYGGSPMPGSATTGASGPGSGPAGSSSMSSGSSSMGGASTSGRGMGSDRTPGMAMGTRKVPMGATTATIPNFGSYNECRAWLANQGTMMNRGPTVNGEVTIVDRDPCDTFRGRRGS